MDIGFGRATSAFMLDSQFSVNVDCCPTSTPCSV
jgi:hypothetical protein